MYQKNIKPTSGEQPHGVERWNSEVPAKSWELQVSAQMDVSKKSGTPKSSILIGFSIINHPFRGTPIFGNTQINGQSFWIHQNWTNWNFILKGTFQKVSVQILKCYGDHGYPKIFGICSIRYLYHHVWGSISNSTVCISFCRSGSKAIQVHGTPKSGVPQLSRPLYLFVFQV